MTREELIHELQQHGEDDSVVEVDTGNLFKLITHIECVENVIYLNIN